MHCYYFTVVKLDYSLNLKSVFVLQLQNQSWDIITSAQLSPLVSKLLDTQQLCPVTHSRLKTHTIYFSLSKHLSLSSLGPLFLSTFLSLSIFSLICPKHTREKHICTLTTALRSHK